MADAANLSVTKEPYNDYEANLTPQPVTVGTIIKGVFWGMWLFSVSGAILWCVVWVLYMLFAATFIKT